MVPMTDANSLDNLEKVAHFSMIAAVYCAEDEQAQPIWVGSAGARLAQVGWAELGFWFRHDGLYMLLDAEQGA